LKKVYITTTNDQRIQGSKGPFEWLKGKVSKKKDHSNIINNVGTKKQMEEILIKSSESDTHLRFSAIQGDYFNANLASHCYSATVRVWAYTDQHGLADLFEALAVSWRGWTGEKKWVSLEGEFSITCTHDKLGHIKLDIEMHQDFGTPESWRLKASIIVDAGQLEVIAKDARKFFKA
jgi:Family of unknown function (DUF6228)